MEKIKHFLESEKGKDVLIIIIVILVGLGSFELGRLSKEDGSAGLKIESASQDNDNSSEQTANNNTNSISEDVGLPQSGIPTSSEKTFFASSKGTKYYTISCSAGKTIKQANRVYFTTGEEAEAAGYKLSSSCN
jgi:hypothetical protein